MFRNRRKKKSTKQPPPPAKTPLDKRESSRLSPLVLSNPVNQSALWSHEAYLLPDLVANFELPRVVRCASRLVPGEEQHMPVNVHVPMLLCQGRTARKLLAKHVVTEGRGYGLMETDDTIAIPSDYDGNFVRLRSRTTQDKSAARTLTAIAQSHAPAFLNFSPLISYPQANEHSPTNGHPIKQQRVVHPPGSVFLVTHAVQAEMKVKRRLRPLTLLGCTDEKGFKVLVPLDQPSEVVEVEVPLPLSPEQRLSQLPQDLLTANRYPGLVRYVYGSQPPRLTPCSRMFTLIDSFEEDSLIGCLLYPNHALMIELPMTSSLAFQVATNHEEVMALSLPRHALQVVTDRRETFARDLKLKCKFLHRVNQGIMASSSSSPSGDDDLLSATVRTRQYANEAFFYL